MKTVIIDYGSGNLTSVAKALSSVAPDGMRVIVTNQIKEIETADYLVLPGVGAFAACTKSLLALDGMVEVLSLQIMERKRPFLGICVGMQILADIGKEHEIFSGLGFVHGEVRAIEPKDGLTIPNIGWHPLNFQQKHILHQGLDQGEDASWFYFVHSYSFHPEDEANIAATFNYGTKLVASLAQENIYATQFHPEKSQAKGQRLLHNFLSWRP